jgi:hypothetical protein
MTILFINNYGPNPATLTGKDFSIYYLWGRPLQTTLCCTELYPRFIFIFYAISGKKPLVVYLIQGSKKLICGGVPSLLQRATVWHLMAKYLCEA